MASLFSGQRVCAHGIIGSGKVTAVRQQLPRFSGFFHAIYRGLEEIKGAPLGGGYPVSLALGSIFDYGRANRARRGASDGSAVGELRLLSKQMLPRGRWAPRDPAVLVER
jgi:hypothetical protein